jgi:hypothetical protein
MPSSIPAARLNLFNLLDAAPALSAVQVTFAAPEIVTEETEVLAILGVESIATEHAVLGVSQQDESYQILLRAKSHDRSCNGSPSELQALDARIWSYYEAVRAAVNANPTLSGALSDVAPAFVATAEPGGGSDASPLPAVTEEGTADGFVAFLDFRLLCRSRIS